MKIRFKKMLYAVLIGSSVMVSCNGQSGSAGSVNKTISVEEFETRLKQGDVQLVDVRTEEEYAGGHLKNALNYNISSPDFGTNIKTLDKNKTVLVYCLSGGRSASAADLMSGEGFKEVYNLGGGIMKWNGAGKSLDAGAATDEKPGMSMEDLNALVKKDKYVLVDFNAKWCKPCLKMLPMLEKITEAKKEKLDFVRIDADENKNLMQQKGISSIPYLELYKEGKLIWKHEGEIDESAFLDETKL
ncbi:MAG: thioredoxin [Bacteroidia bacterium]|nr:thioredoxin [Bacteroidia bacterium]